MPSCTIESSNGTVEELTALTLSGLGRIARFIAERMDGSVVTVTFRSDRGKILQQYELTESYSDGLKDLDQFINVQYLEERDENLHRAADRL